MRVFLTFVFLLLIMACQGVQSVPKPDKIIEKATMENIIYDITIINSARGYNPQLFVQTGVDPECHVFEKYEIDSAQYAQNTLYYSSAIEDYKELIERVRKRVEAKHTVLDSLFKEEKRIKDSIRHERGKRLKQEKDSLNALKKIDSGIPLKTVIEPTLPLQ